MRIPVSFVPAPTQSAGSALEMSLEASQNSGLSRAASARARGTPQKRT